MPTSGVPVLFFAEDDDEDWMLIRELFEEAGSPNKITRYKNGIELLDKLQNSGNANLPNLIFLDIRMPMMSGHEVLAEIRKDPRLCHIPVVFMTGSTSEADIYRGYSKGANSYIPKPVTETNIAILRKYWGEVVLLPKLPRTTTPGP